MPKKKKDIHPVEQIHPRSLKFLSNKLHSLVKGKLWLKVLIGLVLGIITGFIIGPSFGLFEKETSLIIGEWLSLPGIIFLKIIQMIVIPLILASIIRGIASSDSISQLKKSGITIAVYFVITTTIAILIGIAITTFIQPGQYVNQELLTNANVELSAAEVSTPSLMDFPQTIGNILPGNLFGSLVNGEMLQIVIFSIIFGIALISIRPEQSKPLLNLFGSIQVIAMTVVKWAMALAPFAVFGLMAKLTSQFGMETLIGISAYVGTVILGLIILLCLYLVIVFLTSRITPLNFLSKIKDVQLLAFSTSSSAAVMPLSIKTAEENLKIRPSVSQFIIPLGATINMDGTALYQTVATLFLAQVFGVELGITALILLVITIVAATIGAPGTPGVGLAILAVILSSNGIPIVGLALILGVDRILDMCRTVINVTGDLTASTFINKTISSEKTHEQLLKEQKLHEIKRKKTQEDVLIAKA